MMLTERQRILLTIIDEATLWEGDERPGKKLTRYFVPGFDHIWVARFKRFESVRSGGDSSSLRSLEARGLIVRMKPKETGSLRYAYAITEEGLNVIAEDREEHP